MIATLVLQDGFAGHGWFQFQGAYAAPFAVVHIEEYYSLDASGWENHWEVAISTGRLWRAREDPKFMAFRLRNGAVESVNSDDCDFTQILYEMRDLSPPQIFVPGANLSDLMPAPPMGTDGGRAYTLIANTVQKHEIGPDMRMGRPVQMTLNANSGELADWSERFRVVLDQCRWTAEADVMTPPLFAPSGRTLQQPPVPAGTAPSSPGEDGERG